MIVSNFWYFTKVIYTIPCSLFLLCWWGVLYVLGGTLWESYAALYFLIKNRASFTGLYASFMCHRQPRKPNYCNLMKSSKMNGTRPSNKGSNDPLHWDYSIICTFGKGSEKSCSKKTHLKFKNCLPNLFGHFLFWSVSVSCPNCSVIILPRYSDHTTASHTTWWFCNHECTTIFLRGSYLRHVEKARVISLSRRHYIQRE